jgi:hypothetical protein
MGVTTVNASYQGAVSKFASGQLLTWSTDVRNQTVGSIATTYNTSTTANAISVAASTGLRGASASLARCFLFFDLSSITETITDITLKVYGASGGGNLNDTIPVESTAWGGDGTSTSMTTAMYNDLDFSTAYGLAKTAWTGGGYNDYVLNSTAVSDANTNGYINIALIDEDADYSNNSPTFNPSTSRSYSIEFNSLLNLNKVEVTTASGFNDKILDRSPAEGAGGGFIRVNDVVLGAIGKVNDVGE